MYHSRGMGIDVLKTFELIILPYPRPHSVLLFMSKTEHYVVCGGIIRMCVSHARMWAEVYAIWIVLGLYAVFDSWCFVICNKHNL